MFARAAVVLVAWWAGFASAATVPPRFSGLVVRDVEFRSVVRVDAEVLRRLLPVRKGRPLREQDVARSVELLLQKAVWREVEPGFSEADGGVKVVFELRPATVVTGVEVRGVRHLSRRALLRRVRFLEGEVLDPERVAVATRRILELCEREGFPRARVRWDSRPEREGEARVVFFVREGPALLVRSVSWQGTGDVGPAELLRVVGWKEGLRWTSRRRKEWETKLVRFYRKRRHYAARVRLEWEDEETGRLAVRVEPGPVHRVRFSGNRSYSDRRLFSLIDLERRVVVTDGTWRELGRRIEEFYREEGFAKANVDWTIERGRSKRIRYRIEEGRRYRVGSVHVEGTKRVSRRAIVRRLEMRPPRLPFWRKPFFRPGRFEEDLRRIVDYYRGRGFRKARVVRHEIRWDEKRGLVHLRIEVEEGLPSRVRSVRVEGAPEGFRIPPPDVAVGGRWDGERLERERARVESLLRQAGYPEAEVRWETAPTRRGGVEWVDLVMRIVPGPEVRFGTLLVKGNRLTKDRVVLRELGFREGDPFGEEKLVDAEARLYSLGLFRRVAVRPGGSDANTVPVTVDVAERPPGSVEYGFGYNTQLGFRAFGELGYRNLGGMARSATLRGVVNLDASSLRPDQFLGDLGLRDPRLFDSRWSGRLNLIAQRSTREVDRFDLQRWSAVGAVERLLFRHLTFGLEAQFDASDVFDVPDDVLADPRLEGVDDQGFLRTVSVGPFFVLDRRDHSLAPTRGTFDSLRLVGSAFFLGSELDFGKIVAQHAQYIPLGKGLVLAYSLRGGWARPFDGRRTLPIRERFFLGGRSTVRGFDENSIGPQGAEGSPLGGDLVVNTNVELRIPLVWGFEAVGFFDGGAVYLQKEDIDLGDFRRSAGAGLRYRTPVGPISADYGIKLDRRSGESFGAFHFTIGTIF
ncbi:MAG: outer membrane protein, OMP85 family [Candidatus Binatia bacterium]|nr:MAG: outer membrane protein, OMP85 family [Candidatus Binatia bacterium]